MFLETAESSTNNKMFLSALLDLRMQTQEHVEPPVCLMHGSETEKSLRESMMRIKQDQQAAAEAAKKRAAENADSDAPESDNLGDEDSKEETTLQEDMD